MRDILRLSFSLAKTNFKLRNEGSYLGIFWYLLGPLALFFIILFIRSSAFPDATIPAYPIYLLIGITGFNFFRQTITTAIGAVRSNAEFIRSINNISLETFVLANVLEAIFSHAFEVALIAAFMLYFGVPLVGILLYPVALAVFLPFVAGAAFFCAALGVYATDLDNLWAIGSQLLIFGTPVFYLAVPGTAIYSLNLWNPLFYFISTARSLVISQTFPPAWMFGAVLAMGALACFVGIRFFESKKRGFAEEI